MEDLSKTSLVDIIKEMTYLEQQINLQMLRYEKLRLETIRRFPLIENEDFFKKKTKEIVWK